MTLKELFTDESRWTQGCFARDAEGNEVGLEDPAAVKFCLAGGVLLCYLFGERKGVSRVVNKIITHVGHSIPTWADSPERTFADIKRLINELDI